MKYAVLDVETTIRNDGNPFTKGNKICLVGILIDGIYTEFDIEYSHGPYGEALGAIKGLLESVDYVVGFNVKFDLHWIRNYVPTLDVFCVFDCQLAAFILNNQRTPYPSLDGCLSAYDLDSKLNVVKSEYWDHGIDTTEVPRDILSRYLEQDVRQTEALYLKQLSVITEAQKRLIWLQGRDLLILLEMERNGLKYDKERARELGIKTQQRIAEIDTELRTLVASPVVSFGSDDHISSVLYGGVIYEAYREHYERELKGGKVVQRERWSERPHQFERLVDPIKGTETKPTAGMGEDALRDANREREALGKKPYQRHWSVAEPIIKRLKAGKRAKSIINLMLARSLLKKLDSTYYTGLVDKMDIMDSVDGLIHGQFNQVVAVTGRLSSSNPNLQNFSGEIKELFVSRYAD